MWDFLPHPQHAASAWPSIYLSIFLPFPQPCTQRAGPSPASRPLTQPIWGDGPPIRLCTPRPGQRRRRQPRLGPIPPSGGRGAASASAPPKRRVPPGRRSKPPPPKDKPRRCHGPAATLPWCLRPALGGSRTHLTLENDPTPMICQDNFYNINSSYLSRRQRSINNDHLNTTGKFGDFFPPR